MFATLVFCFLFLFSHVHCQTHSNDSSLLSGLWNSLTSVEQDSACPGECLHAITALFCDSILENVNCGDSYLRCCVMNPVTHPPTIPPPQESITEAVEASEEPSFPTEASSIVDESENSKDVENLSTTASSHISEDLSPSSEVAVDEAPQCPVPCSKVPLNAFCVKTMSDVQCSDGEECCLEIESSIDTMTRNLIKLVQETVARNESRNIGQELVALVENQPNTTASPSYRSSSSPSSESSIVSEEPTITEPAIISTSTTTTESSLPPCSGTCVVALFSILCDSTDDQQYCPNGGTCCVQREVTTETPVIGPCQGTCIPVILSGMCNKPYELVLKTTDCSSSTICCADKKSSDFDFSDDSDKMPDVVESQQNAPNPMHQNPRHPYRPNIQHRPLIPHPGMRPGNGGLLGHLPHLHRPMKPHHSSPGNDIHFPHESKPTIDDSHQQNIPRIPKPDAPVFTCPGSCMSTMFRFACLGAHSIYTAFYCAKGQVCCAPNAEIEKFESFLQAQLVQQQQQQQQTSLISQQSQHQVVHQQPPPKQQQQPPKPTPGPTRHHPVHPGQIPPPPPLKPSPNKEVNQHQSPPQIVDVVPQEPSMTPHVCGVKGSRRNGRVVGGSDSFPGEWCWQVAIVNQQNKYLCGGALIDKQWVLTAAHCITGLIRKGELFFVHVGQFDLTRQNRPAVKIAATFVHHNHNTQSLDNDIAILKLATPAELSADICLVCLPTKANKRDPGKRCLVTGYGYQHESGPMALRIREASVPIVEDIDCTRKINKVTERIFTLPVSSFCAGGEGGNDACQGDGGSGLVCEDDGFYELAGLVSWGFGCGRPDVPGVYVKVSSFVGWINQIVSTNNH